MIQASLQDQMGPPFHGCTHSQKLKSADPQASQVIFLAAEGAAVGKLTL